jgi:hypothetical protein
MKKNIAIYQKLLILLIGIAFSMNSCDYEEFRPTEYSESKLYMPAAVRGIFTIDNVPQWADWLPTPGYIYDYKIDVENNKFIVPLGVYRSGIEQKGAVNVGVEVKIDTINILKLNEEIPESTVILPANEYELPTSVMIQDGSELGGFDLEINLDYLLSRPNEIFALAVGILSDEVEVNMSISTTIIVIYPQILVPTADFSYSINGKNIAFSNNSTFGMNYFWNFGNGERSTVKNPTHTYLSSGNYIVTLTTEGVLGSVNQVIAEKIVVVP